MDLSYAVTPFLAWLVAGCTKFAVNTIRAKQLEFGQIGYGGFPSNHTAIVTSAAALVGFQEGVAHPAFGIGVALAFVVMLDANSLRQKVGLQAAAINHLNQLNNIDTKPLRERMGHTRVEIAGGAVVGTLVAWAVSSLF